MPRPYIFILGTGHSGGTLLNLMLGVSPQVLAVGESLHLWNLTKLAQEKDRTRSFWQHALKLLDTLGWPAGRLTQEPVLGAGTDLWQGWTRILSEISPRPVIADKSNHLRLVRGLCAAGLVQPFFVHLVRDPRAVVHSFALKGRYKLDNARSWQITNAAISAFLRGCPDAMVLRYEDLATDPWHHAEQILDRAGTCFGLELRAGIPPDIADRSLDDPLFDNLIFGGNRMRRPTNREGRMIQPDTRYLQGMSGFDWAATTALCLPDLRRFGYPLGRPAMARMLQAK